MNRLNKADVKPSDFLTDVVKSKRKPNKERLEGLRPLIESRFDEYTDKADAGKLNQLEVQWNYAKDDKGSDAYFLYKQYDNSATLISHLRSKIIEANEGEIVLKCPICGLRDAKDLDHYIPRQLFPEYSINPYNLIPTCHDCNNDKSIMWCSNEGKRLIFNAYYDTPTNDFLFDVDVVREKDMLRIKLELKEFNNPSEPTRLAISTLKELNLIPYYNKCINEKFRQRVNEICKQRKHFKLSDEDFWEMEKETWQDLASDISDVNNLDRIVLVTMYDSPLIETWLKEQSKK